uniref:Zinc finger protein 830 n=1 Tax=Nothoprocta perdicaria TaxID=30464 RepID=A0A8C6YZG1_NOTPE
FPCARAARPGAAEPHKMAVRQEELRRLMREKQRQNAGRKRLDSPFAKYNSLGHLSCALCNAPVKSELLWQTHVLGKQHRERVAELKGTKQAAAAPAAGTSPHPGKRKNDTESAELKRLKGNVTKILTKCLAESEIFYFECIWLSVQEKNVTLSEFCIGACSVIHWLLSFLTDFFDSKTTAVPIVSHSGSIQKPEIQEKVVERKENTAEALPEGFFDDPEVDARVRKVDAPKDQMDKEWDEFQKAMRQVNTISEAIVAEEDEEGRLDRQIGEIDEQIECYRRVELLRDRQELMKEKLKEAMRLRASQEKEDEALGSEDEEELQDLLSQDWRVKGTLL